MRASDRVCRGGTSWRLLDGFKADLAALNLDAFTLQEVRALMKRASLGTVRSEEWEYPLETGGNMLGELKLDVEELKYRIYYNEPATEPTVLVAVLIGVKTHDGEGEWLKVQQEHIGTAKARLFQPATSASPQLRLT